MLTPEAREEAVSHDALRVEVMMAKTYPMLSSDGHLEVLPERWTNRMPAKYRELAPHTTTLPDGSDAIVMEGSGPFKVNYIDFQTVSKSCILLEISRLFDFILSTYFQEESN
jgi:hypothetical protein